MKHLSEEEIVDRFYGEGVEIPHTRINSHLDECAECAGRLAVLQNDLAAMRPANVPERWENYGEQMWARVEAALPPRPRRMLRLGGLKFWRALSYGTAIAAVVAGSFYGGRMYEHRLHRKAHAAANESGQAAPAPPKVMVVVLGDHLDRSERLLVELKHVDSDNPELVTPLREEARNLMAPNREFREEADREGDPALTLALDHLDKLLTEIAGRPDGLGAAGLKQIRDEMNADGLLFEVRVLRSQNPHRTKSVRVVARGGAA